MAQVVENWSDIRGRVVEVSPSATRPDFVDVVIDADEVHAVEDWPDLLGDVAGEQIEVLVPRASVSDDLGPGTEIACRVRRARSGLFAHPDHVEVDPSGGPTASPA